MLWVFLAALANRWLWLLAVFGGALLLVTADRWVYALLAAVVVLAVGAGVDAAGQVRRARRPLGEGERPDLPRVADAQAVGQIRRAEAGIARLERAREALGDVPADLSADVGAKATLMLEEMHRTGRQVDRLDVMLAGVDPSALQAELTSVQRAMSADRDAGEDLAEQRRRTVEGLRAQLAAVQRVAEQRELMLERMRATAVGIEGLAVRVGELGALYDATGRVDTTDDDLRAVSGEIEGLRQGLVEAERSVRAALSSTDLPGLPEG